MLFRSREWSNLANKPELASTKASLAKWLPKVDVRAVAGSAHRVLIRDPATGAVTWEGKPVSPTDPIPTP